MPPGFTATDVGGGTRYHTVVIFTGTTLGAGQTVSYAVVVKADATAKGHRVLGAAALAATPDPSYRNNVAVQGIKIT